MLFLLLNEFQETLKRQSFYVFSAFWEFGRPPLRWAKDGMRGRGKMGQLSKNIKSRKRIVLLVFLEIQKQKKQKQHCLLYVSCDTNIEILKKHCLFNVLWNTSTNISFPKQILEL